MRPIYLDAPVSLVSFYEGGRIRYLGRQAAANGTEMGNRERLCKCAANPKNSHT
jgi:hypothetical protein